MLRKTPLRRNKPLKARKPWRRASKPSAKKASPSTDGSPPCSWKPKRKSKGPKVSPEYIAASRAWRDAVFEKYGPYCYLHRLHDPRSMVLAIDPAHIFSRQRLGKAIAFGPKGGPPDPRLGRPLCRDCHERQGDGLDPRYQFPLVDRIEATLAHNESTRGKPWPLPTE